jgi:hypothetical protein
MLGRQSLRMTVLAALLVVLSTAQVVERVSGGGVGLVASPTAISASPTGQTPPPANTSNGTNVVPEHGYLTYDGVAQWEDFSEVFRFDYTPSMLRIPAISVTIPENETGPLGVLSAQRCRATSWNVPLESPYVAYRSRGCCHRVHRCFLAVFWMILTVGGRPSSPPSSTRAARR